MVLLSNLDYSVPADAESKFVELHGLSRDITEDVRDGKTPVGLRNLGATCYVSSHLSWEIPSR
jgi:ubiquitin C-terminal hydrolase